MLTCYCCWTVSSLRLSKLQPDLPTSEEESRRSPPLVTSEAGSFYMSCFRRCYAKDSRCLLSISCMCMYFALIAAHVKYSSAVQQAKSRPAQSHADLLRCHTDQPNFALDVAGVSLKKPEEARLPPSCADLPPFLVRQGVGESIATRMCRGLTSP